MSRPSQSDLLLAFLPVLSGHVRRAVRDRDRARELLQEVCVRVLAGEGPDDPGRFFGWCHGVARHVIAQHYRASKRAREDVPYGDELSDELLAPGFDPDARVDARSWIRRAFADVAADGMELLLRRYLYDEKGKDLADELDQSSATIRMRLKRLRSTVVDRAREPARDREPRVTPRVRAP